MGATKHYHPISLHVIRGAAEYCGWKFGKIKQTSSSPTGGDARYICEIEKMPRGMEIFSIDTIEKQLQHCFMDDIVVKALYRNQARKWYCVIEVALNVIDDTAIQVPFNEDGALPT